VSAFQSFSYAINAANRVGVGGGGVYQRYDGVEFRPPNESYVFRAYGSYVRNFGERTTLSIRVGPAVIVNEQDSISRSEQAFTYDFTAVGQNTTFGELRDTFGDDVDGVSQQFGDSEPVPQGSVLVPDPQSCNSLTPAVIDLLEGSGCERRRVLRFDSTDAGNTQSENNAVLSLIQSEVREVEVVGSTSGSDGAKVTLFGDVTLSHIWTPNLVSTAAYNRSQSTAAGQGVGTIADSVSIGTSWRPTPLWNLSIRGSYVKRKSPNGLSQQFYVVEPTTLGSVELVMRNGEGRFVDVSDSVDTQRFAVGLRAARRITRRLTAAGRADWSKQTATNSSRNPNNFGVFTIYMGIQYDFDPLRF
jgi:hypothetical protein